MSFYNHNSAESWKAQAKKLEGELERAETGLAIALQGNNNQSSNKKNEEYAELWIENREKVDLFDEYIVCVPIRGSVYHKYECALFIEGTIHTVYEAEDMGFKPCPQCCKN
jgi:hypothetical protein